ncbi:TOM1-like protein 2 isoform X2 [Punica granatum]|uniref:TOM1-like protein 2 isoform X2 n=1 Tax=Punica granatum TaxID=22663 RepID=A0A6P8C7P9_PUNGR|nr:TOM1-like protein 2 isoform X2 [Punica granatum]
MERFGNLAQWGEKLKTSGAQMSRMVSEKVKDIMQTPTLESKMVDEATLETMEEPNWGMNLRICSMINREELRGPEVVRAMKRKIASGGSTVSQSLTLDLLEACTMNCEKVFSEVASERVLDEMVRMIDNPRTDQGNRDKALQLISAWGQSESLDYLPVFRQTYMSLKNRRERQHHEESSSPEQYALESYIHREPLSPSRAEGYPIPRTEFLGTVQLSTEEKKEILVETRNTIDLLSSMINTETGQISAELSASMMSFNRSYRSLPGLKSAVKTLTRQTQHLQSRWAVKTTTRQILPPRSPQERERLPNQAATKAAAVGRSSPYLNLLELIIKIPLQ